MRPDREHILMEIAGVISRRSTCSRAQVGAIIAREGRILSSGYNGAPSGMKHCDHSGEFDELVITGHSNECKAYQKRCICDYGKRTVNEGCSIAVHAEANAIAYAARYGINTDNSELYTTLAPCLSCAQLIINCGVKRLFYRKPYRKSRGVGLLRVAGLEVVLCR